ncbi:Rab3 GTPase-activating protein regulatory subunit N-terminus-domain-containing protein, partial [Dunaliella salina]
MRVAAAVHNQVAVFPLGGTSAASEHAGEVVPLGVSTTAQDNITALQWVMWRATLPKLQGHKESQCAGSKPSTSYDTAIADQNTSPNTAAADQSTPHNTAPAHHNACCLMAGTAAGYLQLHDVNGLVLLRQRVHAGGPVLKMQVQPRTMGYSLHDHTEGATVTFSNAVVHIPSAAIRKSLVSCLAARARADAVAAEAATRGGTGAWSAAMAWATPTSAQASPVPEVLPMAPCLKWSMPRNIGPRFDALFLGHRPPSLYEVLQGGAPSTWRSAGNADGDDDEDDDCGGEDGDGCEGHGATAAGRVVLATAGQGPALAALDAPADAGHRGGGIGALAFSLYDYARSARSQVTLSGPSSLRQGIKSFLLAPLLSWESKGSQPLATFDDPAAGCGQGGAVPSLWKCVRDDARTIKALVPAPRGTLLAALDNLGRVWLVDAASQMGVLRMLKGYRDAMCGWLELPSALVQQCLQAQQGLQQQDSLGDSPPGVQASELTPDYMQASSGNTGSCSQTNLVLVIHAPRKQMVEAWLPPYGPRLHVLHRPGSWMLVQPPTPLDLEDNGVGQSSNHGRVARSSSAQDNSVQDRGAGQGGMQGGVREESHMEMEGTVWGPQGADLARLRQEGCCDLRGCLPSCSTPQGGGEVREGGSAQGEGWPSACNARGEEESAGWQGQHGPALASVAVVDRSLALSGCWMLDPSTGSLTSLAALLTLELAASVLRLRAGPSSGQFRSQ